MRILFAPAHYYLSDKYGSEPYWAYEIVRKSAQFGHEVTAIVGVKDYKKPLPIHTQLIVAFPQGRSPNVLIEAFRRLYFIFFVYFQTRKLLKSQSFDVIHHVLPCSIDTFSFLGIFRDRKIPFIMGPLQMPTTGGGRQSFTRTYGANHFSFSAAITLCIYTIAKPILRTLSIITFSNTDVLIFTSDASKKYFKKIFTHIKDRKVIPVGIDMPKSLRKKMVRKHKTFLCVGYLTKRKGHIYALEAFEKLYHLVSDCRLIIAGSGPEKSNLEEYIATHNLQNVVTLVGFIKKEHMQRYYVQADIFLLPSVSDSFPTVILEAMSYGLPIIATKTGSIPEMVGKAGFLVRAKNSNDMFEAMRKLAKNTSLQKRLGILALKRIKKYNWNDIIQEYSNVYKSVLDFRL